MIGWYHSHPNYGAWLSGIDVSTQKSMQTIGPTLAIVIDPIRTETSGRVEIGAFRTCDPDSNNTVRLYYKTISESSIPEDKVKDFGLHYKSYYSLDIEFFMSSKDAEIVEYSWTRFWRTVIESDKLIENKDNYYKSLEDLIKKCKKLTSSSAFGRLIGSNKQEESQEIGKRVKEVSKVSLELSQGAMQDCVKCMAFN